MPAPKGNKYSPGLPKGSSAYDKDEEALALIEWAFENPEALTIPMFAIKRGYSTDTMLAWCKEHEVFRGAYKLAKDMIGANRLKLTQAQEGAKLDKTIYLRGLNNYDSDQRNHDKEMLAYEYSLRKAEVEDTEDMQMIKNQFESLMSQIKKRQASASNNADINKSEESKS